MKRPHSDLTAFTHESRRRPADDVFCGARVMSIKQENKVRVGALGPDVVTGDRAVAQGPTP